MSTCFDGFAVALLLRLQVIGFCFDDRGRRFVPRSFALLRMTALGAGGSMNYRGLQWIYLSAIRRRVQSDPSLRSG